MESTEVSRAKAVVPRFPWKWIARELAVNWIGYKCGVRRALGKGRNNNVHFDIEKDLQDKGRDRLSFIKTMLRQLLGNEFDSFWPPKRALEIGPGGTMLLGLFLCSEGVEEYIGVDAFPSDVWNDYSKQRYDAARRFIPNVMQVVESSSKGNGPIYYYSDKSHQALNHISPSSIDLIFSYGCLEHVNDPLTTFKKSKPLLSERGVALHRISTHGHTWRQFPNPLIHFAISDWLWRLMYDGRGFITRFCASQYIDWAKEAGYQVSELERETCEPFLLTIKPHLLPRFKIASDLDLSTDEITLALR